MKLVKSRIIKRFALVIGAFLVVSAMGLFALGKEMEAVAVTCATGLCGIIGYYVKSGNKKTFS